MSGGFPLGAEGENPYRRYPAPLALAIEEMLEETLVNSADELIHLLEVWLRHLGWLWIVEYLYADWVDDELNQLLFDALYESRREPSVGYWAYIGSAISCSFAQRGCPPQMSVLQKFDYGDPQDAASPLSRMLRYRNSFAHGSFAAVVQDILQHRELFWSLIEPLEGFVQVPICFWDPRCSAVRQADGDWTIHRDYPDIFVPPPQSPQKLTPFVLTPEGALLDLSPAIQIHRLSPPASEESPAGSGKKRGESAESKRGGVSSEKKEGSPLANKREPLGGTSEETGEVAPDFELRYFSVRQKDPEESQRLFGKRAEVQSYLLRYQREREGYLRFRDDWRYSPLPNLPCQQLQDIVQRLQNYLEEIRPQRPNFVLLLGYPGSGKTGIVVQAGELFRGFDGTILYCLDERGASRSGMTCGRFLLRQLESFLEADKGSLLPRDSSSATALIKALEQAFQLLAAQRKRVLVAMDEFHLAYEPYRGESLRVHDLLAELSGEACSALSFLLSARPGYYDDLLRDRVVELPPVEVEEEVADYRKLLRELGLEEGTSTQGLSAEEVRLRRALLFLLGAAPRELTVYQVCTVLERLLEQRPSLVPPHFVFTPHIERSLWELRPVLYWGRLRQGEQQGTKFFAPFCAAFGRWCTQHLYPA